MSWIVAIATVFGIVGFITAVIDMMSNGARYADWAPVGLGVVIIAIVIVWAIG